MSTESKQAPIEAIPTCGICAEPYTTVVRKRIECSSCHKDLCTKCIERYLLSTIEDPHCVYCRTAWPRTFLNTACTNTFLNKTYYAHRQTILVNREKSFLPNYQLAAERTLRIRTLSKEDSLFQDELAKVEARHRQEILVITNQRSALWRRINRVHRGLPETGNDTEDTTRGVRQATEDPTRAVATKFVRRCTATSCNGFLSSVWKCGLCYNWVCPDCFEVKGPEKDAPHTCTPEMLQTAELIRKDTKPCPSCGEMISKIDGCDQMFCTTCHNPFSWITGRSITTGVIHNPHYFQWLAKGGLPNPTNPGHIPCGGLPNPYRVQRALANASKEDRKAFLEILRICSHIGDIERPRYERHLNPVNNEDVGVRYLLKETDEDGWKSVLGKQEKDRQKSNEIRDILDAFYGAAIDLFRRIDVDRTEGPYTKDEATALIVEISFELGALRRFIFQSMIDVSKSFHCSVPLITEDWCLEHGLPSNLARKKRLAEEEKQKEKEKAAAAATTTTATANATATAATATATANATAVLEAPS
jgi:hypothetical protein